MKHKLRCISILLIIAVLTACGSRSGDSGVAFHYCRAEIDYSSGEGIIGSEIRTGYADPLAYKQLLEDYLSGPKSGNLKAPFPAGTKLVRFEMDQQTVRIVLNNEFSQLSGIDLTIACACLCKTLNAITGCANVEISAQGALLDNRQSITMDINNIQFTNTTP